MDIIVKRGCMVLGKKTWLPGQTVPGLPEEEAQRLIAKGKATAKDIGSKTGAASEAEAEAQMKKDLDRTMTVTQLTEELEKLGVDIPSGARKADLIDLFVSKSMEPPRES